MSKSAGFSLVEIAIALIVVALLSAGALTALRVQTQRSHLSDTRLALDNARLSILGFVATQNRLPCPATTNGVENCSSSVGGVPWNTLGITRAEGQDAWGKDINYMVAIKFITAPIHLNTGGAGGTGSSAAGDFVTVCRAVIPCSDGNATNLSSDNTVAFALWSSGEDQNNASVGAPTGAVVAADNADDIVTWVSRYVIIEQLLEAGRSVPP